jgi:hypothetical protein
VTSTVQVDGPEEDPGFTIFPNPASSSVTCVIQLESSDPVMFSIVDLQGKTVYQDNLDHLHPGNNQMELDVSDLQDGIYFCQLTQHGKLIAKQKLVISR